MRRKWSGLLVLIVGLLLTGCQGVAVTPSTPAAGASTVAVSAPPPVQWLDLRSGNSVPGPFVTFAQCQFEIPMQPDSATDLYTVKDESRLAAQLRACVKQAVAEKVQVLIFPEMALAMSPDLRQELLNEFQTVARTEHMLIVAGTFYDADRCSRIAVIGPNGTAFGYKLKPSCYEVSPVAGKGMSNGPAVTAVHSDFGDFAIPVCVDLISDESQYVVRRLATQEQIQAVIVLCCNPAAWEFLIESNSLARRHPIFVLLNNVMVPPGDQPDNGFRFGHTALCGAYGHGGNDAVGLHRLQALLPPVLLTKSPDGKVQRQTAFDAVIADLDFNRQAMLVYDLNLALKTAPRMNNAPDQGYPTVRNLRILPLTAPVDSRNPMSDKKP